MVIKKSMNECFTYMAYTQDHNNSQQINIENGR